MPKKPYNKYMIKNIWKSYAWKAIRRLTVMGYHFSVRTVKYGLARRGDSMTEAKIREAVKKFIFV